MKPIYAKSDFFYRPFIGAELFIFYANSRNKSEISVLQGSQMALNICIQLKNPSKIPCLQVTKIYCLLAARPSERLSTDRKEECFNACKIDEMVQLNNMLLMFVEVYAGKTNKMSFKDTSVDDWMTACLPLQMNKNGQGFSSCLLDVSAFPVGSYRIKWHCCCTDESGSYWSLLPLTSGTLFTVKKPWLSDYSMTRCALNYFPTLNGTSDQITYMVETPVGVSLLSFVKYLRCYIYIFEIYF